MTEQENTAELVPEIRLPSKVKAILNATEEIRIKFVLTDRWINYPRASEIIEELNYLLRQPRRERMEGMLLLSCTNNGKTALVNHFIRTQWGRLDGKIAYVEIPTRSTLKMFYMTLLKVLGIPSTRSETTVELHFKILAGLQHHKVRMLFVDEIHNLLESKRESLQDVLNGLKGLSNQAKIPIILVGIETAGTAIYIDSQISSRFPAWELPRWEPRHDFRDFLNTFEFLLPLRKPSNLSAEGTSDEILKFSNGLIGDVVKIITRSAERAIKEKEESISIDLIRSIGGRIAGQRNHVSS